MSDDRLADWKLVIVGSGSDENNYKSYVAENDIKNIYFEGNKNPLPYYQKASVFLMTSALESWGLTITEAQQFGAYGPTPPRTPMAPVSVFIALPSKGSILLRGSLAELA